MCATSLGWRHLVNAYRVKAGSFIPFVDKSVGLWVAGKSVIRLTRAIPERIRGGLRRCAIQIDVYFTLLTPGWRLH